MSRFLQHAEDILDVAAQNDSEQDFAIVIDRSGGMRLMDAGGWSLSAMSAEFGADAVFRVERRGDRVRVEGCDHEQRCLIQQSSSPLRLSDLPAGLFSAR